MRGLFVAAIVLVVLGFVGATTTACESDADCNDLGAKYVCSDESKYLDSNRYCEALSLSTDFSANPGRHIGAMLVALVGGGMAAATGLGGGGIFVPMGVLVLGLSAHVAIPLSKAAIFGSALSSLIVNLRTRHPEADRPVIEFTAASVLEPMTLGGAVLGVFANIMFPSWIILSLLVVLLAWMGLKTLRKARLAFAKEKAADEAKAAQEVEMSGVEADVDDVGLLGKTQALEAGGDSPAVSEFLESEKKIPSNAVGVLCTMWLFTVLMVVLRGDHSVDSVVGIETCSPWYWTLTFFAVAIPLPVAILAAKAAAQRYKAKQAAGYSFLESDVVWKGKNLTKVPIYSVAAGFLASLLGIGGGLVKTPILMHMAPGHGMIPIQVSATSHFMILFTSSSTVLQYLYSGSLPLSFAACYAALSFCGSIFGKLVLNSYLKRTGKQSMVLVLLGILIVISAVAMVTASGISIADEVAEGNFQVGFASPC